MSICPVSAVSGIVAVMVSIGRCGSAANSLNVQVTADGGNV
jgi:hypothetical protein